MGGKVNLYGQKGSRCFCTTLCMLLYSNVLVATIASNTNPYTSIAFPPQVVKPARKGTSVPSVTPPYYTNMIFLFLWIPCYKDNIFYYIHETSQKIICQNLWQTNPFIACQQNRTPIKTELIHGIYPDQGAEKLFPENGKSIRSQRGSRRHLPHSRLPRKIPP